MQEQRPDDLDGNTFFLYCDIKPLRFFQARLGGGGGGIRTHGTFTRTTVFETAPFDRSGTPPWQPLVIFLVANCQNTNTPSTICFGVIYATNFVFIKVFAVDTSVTACIFRA